MEAGQHNPHQTQQAQDEERVIEPEPSACINTHQNACSDEHLFERKGSGEHKRITTALVFSVSIVAWFNTACLTNPQREQSLNLLQQLASARAAIDARPLQADNACATVGDVQSRLTGEPGLVELRPVWLDLHNAAQALQAVCGQATLLSQSTDDTLPLAQARERWQRGIQREMTVACDYLRAAAAALERQPTC